MKKKYIISVLNIILMITILFIIIYKVILVNYDTTLTQEQRREIIKINTTDIKIYDTENNSTYIESLVQNNNILQKETAKNTVDDKEQSISINKLNAEIINESKNQVKYSNYLQPNFIFQSNNIEENKIENIIKKIKTEHIFIVPPYYMSYDTLSSYNNNIFIQIPVKNDDINNYTTGPLYISDNQPQKQNINNIIKIISQYPNLKGFFISYLSPNIGNQFLENFFDICKQKNLVLIIKDKDTYDLIAEYLKQYQIDFIVPDFVVDKIEYYYQENLQQLNNQKNTHIVLVQRIDEICKIDN